jgi:hypothetical protein
VAAAVLLVARTLRGPLGGSAFGRTVVRAGFALVPLLGVVALGQDLGELY